jgi:hypothetical protein
MNDAGTRRPGTCHALGCSAATPQPFCAFHWELVPQGLKTAWRHRDRAAPRKPLVSRMIAAVERAQFGERLL